MNKIEQEYIQQKEKLKKFESIFEEFNQEKRKASFFYDSDILKGSEKKLLLGWLPSTPIYTTLLFNSRNDGDSIELITNALLDKSHTLVIIQTKDGYKFGGYATQKWKKSEKIYDKNAFVFSLDKGKKYKIIKPENSYYLSSWWGFGADENAIIVVENCTSSNNNFVDNKTYDIKEKYELNGGKQYFTIESFEIFHIKY